MYVFYMSTSTKACTLKYTFNKRFQHHVPSTKQILTTSNYQLKATT